MTATQAESCSAEAGLCGDVVCEVVASRSALTRVWSTNPLKLLTPANHGLAQQVVLSSYGGGLLGGDHVGVRAVVKADAKLVLTTQSAGKVYRTDGLPSSQALGATVGDGALLAVLPDPLCAFANSRFHQRQRFDLAPTGNLIWLDSITSGRHGRGERWVMREMKSRTEIVVGGKVRVRETLSLDSGVGAIASVMRVGRFDCYAVLCMIGPQVLAMAEQAKAVVRSIELSTDMQMLASDSLLAGGMIFRILGPDVQTVQALLRRMLQPLDELIGQNPWGRKW